MTPAVRAYHAAGVARVAFSTRGSLDHNHRPQPKLGQLDS